MQTAKSLFDQFLNQLTQTGALIDHQSQIVLHNPEDKTDDLEPLNLATKKLFQQYDATEQAIELFEVVFSEADTAEYKNETIISLCALMQLCHELTITTTSIKAHITILNINESLLKLTQTQKQTCITSIGIHGKSLSQGLAHRADQIIDSLQSECPHPHDK